MVEFQLDKLPLNNISIKAYIEGGKIYIIYQCDQNRKIWEWGQYIPTFVNELKIFISQIHFPLDQLKEKIFIGKGTIEAKDVIEKIWMDIKIPTIYSNWNNTTIQLFVAFLLKTYRIQSNKIVIDDSEFNFEITRLYSLCNNSSVVRDSSMRRSEEGAGEGAASAGAASAQEVSTGKSYRELGFLSERPRYVQRNNLPITSTFTTPPKRQQKLIVSNEELKRQLNMEREKLQRELKMERDKLKREGNNNKELQKMLWEELPLPNVLYEKGVKRKVPQMREMRGTLLPPPVIKENRYSVPELNPQSIIHQKQSLSGSAGAGSSQGVSLPQSYYSPGSIRVSSISRPARAGTIGNQGILSLARVGNRENREPVAPPPTPVETPESTPRSSIYENEANVYPQVSPLSSMSVSTNNASEEELGSEFGENVRSTASTMGNMNIEREESNSELHLKPQKYSYLPLSTLRKNIESQLREIYGNKRFEKKYMDKFGFLKLRNKTYEELQKIKNVNIPTILGRRAKFKILKANIEEEEEERRRERDRRLEEAFPTSTPTESVLGDRPNPIQKVSATTRPTTKPFAKPPTPQKSNNANTNFLRNQLHRLTGKNYSSLTKKQLQNEKRRVFEQQQRKKEREEERARQVESERQKQSAEELKTKMRENPKSFTQPGLLMEPSFIPKQNLRQQRLQQQKLNEEQRKRMAKEEENRILKERKRIQNEERSQRMANRLLTERVRNKIPKSPEKTSMETPLLTRPSPTIALERARKATLKSTRNARSKRPVAKLETTSQTASSLGTSALEGIKSPSGIERTGNAAGLTNGMRMNAPARVENVNGKRQLIEFIRQHTSENIPNLNQKSKYELQIILNGLMRKLEIQQRSENRRLQAIEAVQRGTVKREVEKLGGPIQLPETPIQRKQAKPTSPSVSVEQSAKSEEIREKQAKLASEIKRRENEAIRRYQEEQKEGRRRREEVERREREIIKKEPLIREYKRMGGKLHENMIRRDMSLEQLQTLTNETRSHFNNTKNKVRRLANSLPNDKLPNEVFTTMNMTQLQNELERLQKIRIIKNIEELGGATSFEDRSKPLNELVRRKIELKKSKNK